MGARYLPLFDELPPLADPGAWEVDESAMHQVVPGAFVTVEDGTGIVHQAPYGADDWETARAHRMPLPEAVGPEGRLVCDVGSARRGTFFKDGVLMVMTLPDIADRTVRMQIYDCRDILHPIQDFPGVEFQLQVDGSGIGPVIDPGGGDAGEIPIAELVRAHTGGKTWDENPKFSINLQNGLLVVKQTPEVHRQVVRLLDMLRRNK